MSTLNFFRLPETRERELSRRDSFVRKRELWAMDKADKRCACRHCIGRFVRNEPIDCCGCLV